MEFRYYFSEILWRWQLDLQLVVLKTEEKMMENVRGSDQF